RVPALTPGVWRAAGRRPRNPSWLFPGPPPEGQRHAAAAREKGVLKKAFRKAREAAGVPKPATIHSLRHSWATHLIENGVSVRVVQLWMGHTSPTTTAIYTHLTKQVEECAAKALDKLTPGMP